MSTLEGPHCIAMHCGQILQKIQARGRAPPSLAMPAFWVHMVPQPLPYQANRQLLSITLRWWWMNERICTLVHVLLTLSGDCSRAIIHPPYHTGRPQMALFPGYNAVPLVSKVNPWFCPCFTTNTWSEVFYIEEFAVWNKQMKTNLKY